MLKRRMLSPSLTEKWYIYYIYQANLISDLSDVNNVSLFAFQ